MSTTSRLDAARTKVVELWDAALPEGVGCHIVNPGAEGEALMVNLLRSSTTLEDASLKQGRRNRNETIRLEFQAVAFIPTAGRLALEAGAEALATAHELVALGESALADNAVIPGLWKFCHLVSAEFDAGPYSDGSYLATADVVVEAEAFLT